MSRSSPLLLSVKVERAPRKTSFQVRITCRCCLVTLVLCFASMLSTVIHLCGRLAQVHFSLMCEGAHAQRAVIQRKNPKARRADPLDSSDRSRSRDGRMIGCFLKVKAKEVWANSPVQFVELSGIN